VIDTAIKAAISAHALSEYPRECCGLLVGGAYLPCRNASATPRDNFEISAADYADAEDSGTITAIVHSHPGASARPSMADMSACEASGLPWVIVSLGAQVDGSIAIEDWHTFEPSGYSAPLIGCEFSHGLNDCYGLIRRYYWQKHGVTLPDFPRRGEWWNDGRSDLYAQFPDAGFARLPNGDELRPGDVLLMHIRSRNAVPNHAAVFLGDGVILHHLWGQLSRRDQLGRYLPHVSHFLRYGGELSTKLEASAYTEF